MTRVEKLSILGVRSFGNEDEDWQTIKFLSPLTLILGQNGCGKTTIIESLKFALTGELPHGGGTSFIHDPKVANSREVMGQIRLQFYDIKGKEVTIVRSMKCAQSSAKLSYSTLDQIISRKDEFGAPVSLDTRCADIEAEMSQSVGVSKAVMTNVLFCPQNESNWPLDEGGKVKEKFDAIFDATQYNKCLENVRKHIKEKMKNDVTLLAQNVEHFSNYKKEAEEKKRNLASEQQRLAQSRDEIKNYQHRLAPIAEKLNHIISHENKFHEQNTILATKSTKLEAVLKQLKILQENIKTLYPGSTEELRQAIYSFKTELRDKERFLDDLLGKSREVEEEEKRARSEVGLEQVKFGQLQEGEKQYKRLLKDRNMKLKSMARELSISHGSSFDEPSQYEVMSLMDDIERKLKDLEDELESCRMKCKSEEAKLQAQVNDARDKKVKIEQEINMKEKQLNDNKLEVSKLKSDLAEVQSSAGRITKLEDDLKRADNDLKDEESVFDLEAEKLAMIDLKEKRTRLQSRVEELNEEVHSLQRLSGLQAELEVHKQAQSSKEAEINRLKRKNTDTLNHLLQKVPERDFNYAVETRLEKLRSDITDMNYQLREKEKELASMESNRKHLKEQIRKKEDLLRENQDQLIELCGSVDGYEEKVASLRRQIEQLQDNKGTLSSSEHLFRQYIKKLDELKPCCPLCLRDFQTGTEAQSLASDLNRKMRELPMKLRQNKIELDKLEEKYGKLLELKPMHRSISEINERELPDLRRREAALNAQIQDVKMDIENLQSDLQVPQADEDAAKSMMSDMVLLDQNIGELLETNREIDRITACLPPGESTRTMKSAQAEQRNVQQELQDAMKEYERRQSDINAHSEKISKLREKRNLIMGEKLKLQSGIQGSNSLREKLKEKEEFQEVVDMEISLKRSELREADGVLRDRQTEKDRTSIDLHKKFDEKREKVENVKRHYKEIESLNKAIKRMESEGVEENVAASRSRLERLGKNAEAAFSKRQELLQKIDETRLDLSTQEVKERELTDNLQLRELESQKSTLESEKMKIQQDLRGINIATMHTEKVALVRENDEISKKMSMYEGKKIELEKNILQLERELKKDIFKNAEKDYSEKYFELMSTKKAIKDLEQFSKALDWAIMHFHQERMQSINSIIRELWISVYKGNDVDYIEIKTNDGAEGTTMAGNRRSYKYRVIMVKNGVEVDMRDRCSAGQRMLACLIIRIALAETFSAKCGVFALDEPTANLDFDNSVSLSEALAEIVKRRFSQKNFQLIVITHDEKFVESLAKEGNLEYYYRVSRNARGKSVIKKLQID
ncbi:DNA repair protein RAD50 [Ischnura elegans]|uniref:DNA repair protein RAD50 n=1 Tax=Ischnura elegans TaxID=197161 RepID=UPI001ED8A30B|nr:DNA repair protein RAD50 [Ischnura elegans]